MCQIIESIIVSSNRMKAKISAFGKVCEKVFVFALCWGIGSVLKEESSILFDSFCSKCEIDVPRGPMFEFYVNSDKIYGEYVEWKKP